MLWAQLSLGPFGPGREICFRRVQSRGDHIGEGNYWGSISELLAPDRFAERISRELRMQSTVPADPSLEARKSVGLGKNVAVRSTDRRRQSSKNNTQRQR